MSALDRYARLKSRVITIRPRAPWYTEEIAEAKKTRRRAERPWRRTKESDDRLIYVNLCKSVNAIPVSYTHLTLPTNREV